MSLTDMQVCFQHTPAYYMCDEVFSLIILYVTLVRWYLYPTNTYILTDNISYLRKQNPSNFICKYADVITI